MAAAKKRKSTNAIPGLTEFVEDHIDEPVRKIARLFCANYPGYDVEQIRRSIRYRIGQNGTADRKKAQNQHAGLIQLRKKAAVRASGCPETVEHEITPFALPKGMDLWFMIADAHIPFHVPEVIERAVEWTKERYKSSKLKVGIIINGDWVDCYSCSSYIKDPTKVDLQTELDLANDGLDYLEDEFQPDEFVFKLGNHENRLAKMLMTRAPQLLKVNAFSWQAFLEAEKRKNFRIVDWATPIQYKNLDILHGDELRSSHHPVNPARTALSKTKFCTIVAHSHQRSEHSEQNSRRVNLTSWSMGCACGLTPDYNPMAYLKWNHGFTILDLTEGTWRVHNMKVIDGREVV